MRRNDVSVTYTMYKRSESESVSVSVGRKEQEEGKRKDVRSGDVTGCYWRVMWLFGREERHLVPLFSYSLLCLLPVLRWSMVC